MKTILLIDANSIIHRSFHALPPLTTPTGAASGAIYGIASILIKLWRDERPDYAAALFDRPEPTFRDKIYAEYKGKRPPTPSDLIAQIIEAHHLFEAFGVTTFEKPGYEADDLIATLAENLKKEKDVRVMVLTGDHDTLQLVEGEKVVIKTFNKGVSDTTIYDEKTVMEKYGLRPNQMIDYKALAGDASDNIKGVPGIGPKTATEMLQRFGTLEELYKNVPGDEKLEKKFGPFKKEANLSRELVILERHVPVEIPALEKLASQQEPPLARAYLETMGFSTLLRRMDGKGELPGKKKNKKLPPAIPEETRKPKSVQGRMF